MLDIQAIQERQNHLAALRGMQDASGSLAHRLHKYEAVSSADVPALLAEIARLRELIAVERRLHIAHLAWPL